MAAKLSLILHWPNADVGFDYVANNHFSYSQDWQNDEQGTKSFQCIDKKDTLSLAFKKIGQIMTQLL